MRKKGKLFIITVCLIISAFVMAGCKFTIVTPGGSSTEVGSSEAPGDNTNQPDKETKSPDVDTEKPNDGTGDSHEDLPDNPSEGLAYVLNSDGNSYNVSGIGECKDTKIVIPAAYNNLPVTGIEEYAFRNCQKLTKLALPDSVTSIGNYAFYGCSGLTSVTIPNGVTNIASGAFAMCSGLTGITIPDSVTNIGSGAFLGCEKLTGIVIPSNVTIINNGAFSNCAKLTSIKVDSGNSKYHSAGNCIIETATGELIVGCKTSIIPTDGSVKSLGWYAFNYCTELTSITIPESVTDIGVYTFSGCSGLTSITVDSRNPKYHSAGNCVIETATGELIAGCKTSIIPADGSVKSISDGAFEGCTTLTSITIPASVTSIDPGPFERCTGLTSIKVDSRNPKYHSAGNCIIETATGKLIAGCKTSIIPADGSVKSIGSSAFCGITGITGITIPDSVTSIGWYAFQYCSGLTSITIGNNVTSIDGFAFSGCLGLTGITIPSSVTSINMLAFAACTELEDITILGTVTSIDHDAFTQTKYYNNEANWSDGVLYIGNHLIEAKKSLSGNYTIKAGTKCIAGHAFRDCTEVTGITIPDSVISIGSYAFSDTVFYNDESNWTDGVLYIGNYLIGAKNSVSGNYTIKAGTKYIAGYAFEGCDKLTEITIPDSVVSIDIDVFNNCSALTAITFKGTKAQWKAISLNDGKYTVHCTDGDIEPN